MGQWEVLQPNISRRSKDSAGEVDSQVRDATYIWEHPELWLCQEMVLQTGRRCAGQFERAQSKISQGPAACRISSGADGEVGSTRSFAWWNAWGLLTRIGQPYQSDGCQVQTITLLAMFEILTRAEREHQNGNAGPRNGLWNYGRGRKGSYENRQWSW